MQAATPTSSKLVRYTVHTSDVLSDNRVNISEEGSERVIWYKERFLADEEIIEHIVDNATSTVLWTVHKPLRGWYIRLRSPSFPPTTFISLVPVPQSSLYHTPAAMSFSCRTTSPPAASAKSSLDSEVTLSDQTASRSPPHTYPPAATPPAVLVSPPSPSSVHAKLDQLAKAPRPKPRSQISQFLLTPHAQPAVPHSPEGGLFTRALRALKNNAPAHSNSFTLSPLPPTPPTAESTPNPPAAHHHHVHPHLPSLPTPPTPLLIFHDTTPVFTVASTSGVVEIDLEEIGKLGVDLAFWIAMGLAYGEFLADREGYLAAAAD
ncbi:hypothetical protein BV25DRAFT_774325 [Artomyces pyxidatus]|uniref:Uncharacterized protein n=1 Tax=Artomyces pyxidatus TaxID=48021 RepID=A0ACB8SXT3_9AGAM|nr:hypothetical protein BV25DRAFT_774325 [Artomyces pyxidatus]